MLRRKVLKSAAVLSGTAVLGAPALVRAQTKEVKVAVIAPLSGPWARQGQLMQMGAEMAIEEINEKGGIASIGGAKMKLILADAGDTAEKAKNAAQRILAQEPDLVGGTGAWLSSFTLAVTEMTYQAKLLTDRTAAAYEVFLTLALFYLVITGAVAGAMRQLERRLAAGGT